MLGLLTLRENGIVVNGIASFGNSNGLRMGSGELAGVKAEATLAGGGAMEDLRPWEGTSHALQELLDFDVSRGV